MAPKITTPGAPGPDAVEALASPMFARYLQAALDEATDALKAQYHRKGDAPDEVSALTPTQAMTLDALRSLGAQLVTATTPAGGAS